MLQELSHIFQSSQGFTDNLNSKVFSQYKKFLEAINNFTENISVRVRSYAHRCRLPQTLSKRKGLSWIIQYGIMICYYSSIFCHLFWNTNRNLIHIFSGYHFWIKRHVTYFIIKWPQNALSSRWQWFFYYHFTKGHKTHLQKDKKTFFGFSNSIIKTIYYH